MPPLDEDAADIAVLLRWGARGDGAPARMWHHPSRADVDPTAQAIALDLARIQRQIIENGRALEIQRQRIADERERRLEAFEREYRAKREQERRETEAQHKAWMRDYNRQQAILAAGAAKTDAECAYWLNYAERMKQTTERET